MVSSYPVSTNIPRVDGLSTGPPGNGASQLGIRAKVNDYLGSSVSVFISRVLIPASQLGIRAKVNDYLGSSVGVELGMRLLRQSWDMIRTLHALCYVCLDV